MRTTNLELLAEIDSLCQTSGVESHQLELVKRVEELEESVRRMVLFAQLTPDCDDIIKFGNETLNKK